MTFVRSAVRRLRSAFGLDVYRRPEVAVETVRLGDPGGRWSVVPAGLGPGTVVYALGVGTDISFERDLIARYGVVVHAFDPTPIALEWAASRTLPGGFVLHPYGVADFDGRARFAPPRKRKFASFSLVRSGGLGAAVEAPVHRLATLAGMLRLPPPDLVKMDIEGAEYGVLPDLLASGFRPSQILVEFHHRWREVGPRRTREALGLLARHGYRIADVSDNGMEYGFLLSGGKREM
ncbi:MAG TPA: FkbM family methyltransferase [Gemmatimonadales bacterium]